MRRAGQVLLAVFVAALPAAHVAAMPASGLAPHLGLIAQTFNVAADGTIDLTVELPAAVDLAAAPDATVVITAYRQVDTREAVAAAIDGDLPRSVDSVDLPATALERPAADQLRAVVPLESSARTPEALQLSRPGVYPVVIEVQQEGELLADLLTFVHRLPTADEPTEAALQLALVVATSEPVILDDDIAVVIDDAVMAELEQLADVIEASAIPVAVRLPPGHLAALADAGPEGAALASRLQGLLGATELLSAPSLPLDPSLAAAADDQARYTQWLRDGEDVLAGLTATQARRTIALVDEPLSQGGGALLRDLGGRMLVLPVDWYDGLPGTLGGFTDSTQLVQVEVAPGVTIDATLVDRVIDDTLASATTTPVLTAIQTAADLLATRQQIDDGGGDPRRHGITLATPDLALPPSATVAAITDLLATTPGLHPTTLDDLSVRTDRLLNDGTEAVVGLPAEVEGSIVDRVATSAALTLEGASTMSMLPEGDRRGTEWPQLANILPTSALTDEQVTAITEDLRGQYAAVLGAVQLPESFSFTLTGRSSVVPVKLFNSSDAALMVKVRMSSPKLLFPDPPQLVTLEPGEYTEVQVEIEARTNGRFPVTLEVLTPLGDTLVGPPVPLTASVRAFSGLGNLVTGAMLLVLVTWWVRHVRQNRRKRAAGNAAQRHPAMTPNDPGATASPDGAAERPAPAYPMGEADAGGDIGSDRAPVDDSGLSPDAATSTLPPS